MKFPRLKAGERYALHSLVKGKVFQFGGNAAGYRRPVYFKKKSDLPFRTSLLDGNEMSYLKLDVCPVDEELFPHEEEDKPRREGVMYIGQKKYKITDYGRLEKEKPFYDLTSEQINVLVRNPLIVRVEV